MGTVSVSAVENKANTQRQIYPRKCGMCKQHTSQMLHVWNIYLHLPPKWPKCRQIFHTWSIWAWLNMCASGKLIWGGTWVIACDGATSLSIGIVTCLGMDIDHISQISKQPETIRTRQPKRQIKLMILKFNLKYKYTAVTKSYKYVQLLPVL